MFSMLIYMRVHSENIQQKENKNLINAERRRDARSHDLIVFLFFVPQFSCVQKWDKIQNELLCVCLAVVFENDSVSIIRRWLH